jgi:hypothetical protein
MIKTTSEEKALKIELGAVISRRYHDDPRPNNEQIGIVLSVMGELLADLIFSAARDQAQGERLLFIVNSRVRSRWAQLAKGWEHEFAEG